MTKQVPSLTICFPLYRQHDLVRRALTALKEQTFKDFQVIFLDDQSPENFESLAEEFRTYFPIEIKYNHTNLGAMKNIWQSIHIATDSPYIMSHHADDFLKADYLEKAITELQKNTSVSFVLTGPIWIPSHYQYEKVFLHQPPIDFFDASQFAYNILNRAPYMFGSVIYRRNHLIQDWHFMTYNTFCDRYFLGEILRTHNSYGVYIHGNGIYENDHSLDPYDKRTVDLNEDHAINLLAFYKQLLQIKLSEYLAQRLITNNALFYFGNFDQRSSLWQFYKKQKPAKLITISAIRGLGVYSLVTLPLSVSQKRKLSSALKKWL